MANKRRLKKQIRHVCGDLAGECIFSNVLMPGIDKEKMNEIVIKIAELQTAALARTNVSFDKTPRDFDTRAEYVKAHRAYFAKAYKALCEGFNGQVAVILKEMNASLPAKK